MGLPNRSRTATEEIKSQCQELVSEVMMPYLNLQSSSLELDDSKLRGVFELQGCSIVEPVYIDIN